MISTHIRIRFIMWFAYKVVRIPIDVRFQELPEYRKIIVAKRAAA